MNYYYDTEFLEGTQTITPWLGWPSVKTEPTIDLISIGIVCDDGREYYAISKSFNLKEAWNRYDVKQDINNAKTEKVYWIRENVLKPIFKDKNKTYNILKSLPYRKELSFNYKNFKMLIGLFGKTNKEIAEEIVEFCYTIQVKVSNKITFTEILHPQLDKIDIKLYGYYSAYNHVVLCWLFGNMVNLPKGFPMYTIDLKQTIDEINNKYKEDNIDFNLKEDSSYPQQTDEHHALADARFNKKLHNCIMNWQKAN